ncbi:MAG: hypothetical protein JW940_21795 [Polyangiaceae bacterium]|nr:hypothetical protein [Polyangiaceae bacterium]
MNGTADGSTIRVVSSGATRRRRPLRVHGRARDVQSRASERQRAALDALLQSDRENTCSTAGFWVGLLAYISNDRTALVDHNREARALQI